MGVVWREDPPWIRPSELFQPAQNVLQERRCFSEPLVARPRSVDKRLGLPCGAFETTRSECVGGAKKKSTGTKKSWWVRGYRRCNHKLAVLKQQTELVLKVR